MDMDNYEKNFTAIKGKTMFSEELNYEYAIPRSEEKYSRMF